MAASGERAAEESLTRRIGARFVYDPEIKSRRIVGVSKEVAELFSKARSSIEARYDEWERRFIADHGKEPNEKQRAGAMHKIAVSNRKPKLAKLETDLESADRWDEELAKAKGAGFKDVAEEFAKAARKRTTEGNIDLGSPDAVNGELVGQRAVAEVGRVRSVFTRYHVAQEVNRQIGDLAGMTSRDSTALLRGITEQALGLPEVTPLRGDPLVVPPELRRASDGKSIYAPRDDVLYALTETLSDERWLRALPLRTGVSPAVDPERAERRIEASGLWRDPRWTDQRGAVKAALTSGRTLELLIGPAGTGKSYTVAGLAQLWCKDVGTPVVGVALSDVTAQNLQGEGLKDSTNLARWFKVQERAAAGGLFRGEEPLVLKPHSLVVVDEASMVSTPDLARLCRMVEAVGGKVLLTGDHHQLMAIEGSGALRMIADDREVIRAGAVSELTEVARFELREEGDASLRLRLGDPGSLDFYDRHGRVEGGSESEMVEMAYRAHFTACMNGKRSLLIVPTNERSAEMSTRFRNDLVDSGAVDNQRTITLRDRCLVGRGDRIVCRKPERNIRDSTGQTLSNRHEFEVLGVRDDGSLRVRRDLGRTKDSEDVWSDPLTLPANYVEKHVRLAYASTGEAAQGRTVDEGFLVADARSRREYVYVGLSRGKFCNSVFVIVDPPETDAMLTPPEQAVCDEALQVLTDALQRTGAEPSASEVLAAELDADQSLTRIGPRWADACARLVARKHEALLRHTVGDEVAELVAEDPAAPAFWSLVQDAETRGYDVDKMLRKAVGERELDSADSIAEVLHWRIRNYTAANAPDRMVAGAALRTSYVDRTPELEGLATPNLAGNDRVRDFALREAAKADRRVAVLGQRLAEEPPLWALTVFGSVPASGEALDDWKRRAGLVEAYREQYVATAQPGEIVTDPIGRAPKPGLAPHRHYDWLLADDALGHPDRRQDVAYLPDVELRDRVRRLRLIEAAAPNYVEDELRRMRRELKASEHDHATSLRVREGRPSRQTVEKAGEVKRLRAEVAEKETIHFARHNYFEEHAELVAAGREARTELARRNPEDPTLRTERSPEEIRAEMSPEERRRYEQESDRLQRREHQRSDVGRSLGFDRGL